MKNSDKRVAVRKRSTSCVMCAQVGLKGLWREEYICIELNG